MIIGYVQYDYEKLPNINYLDRVIYAFAEPYVVNNKIIKLGLEGDEEKLLNILKLKELKPELKISLCINNVIRNKDNKIDGGFSAIASTHGNRIKFANMCLELVEKYNLDGIDIDWEFPTVPWRGNKCSIMDKQNFTLLLRDTRLVLGDKYSLSYCSHCMIDKFCNAYDSIEYVDFMNVMCYDMSYGEIGRPHNAIKYNSCYWDIGRTIKKLEVNNIPFDKVNIGIPFYGRNNFSGQKHSDLYYWKIQEMIRNNPDKYKVKYIDSIPYLIENEKIICSYDDSVSIEAKIKYLKENGINGVMFWECNGDDDKSTLQQAIYRFSKQQ